MKSFAAALVTLLITIISFNAWACGDSLYRVGKGVAYRVYTAPLPGNVLVYGNTEGAEELAKALSESGHNVEVVNSQVDLSMQMQSGEYDVVIGAYSDHDAIEASVESATGSKADYLPVALSDEEESMAKQSYDSVLVADRDEIKHYLRAIHKSLKTKA
jgi:menaquinone-dependent protoporphyrinogen IX oxidase